jgi:hypothetical protein
MSIEQIVWVIVIGLLAIGLLIWVLQPLIWREPRPLSQTEQDLGCCLGWALVELLSGCCLLPVVLAVAVIVSSVWLTLLSVW